MPTYDYRCLKCKKKFERLQRMSEKALTACPYCKGKVERLIGAGAGLIFKGSGFYQTDYKNKSSDKPAAEKVAPDKPVADKPKDAKAGGASGKKSGEKK